MAGNINRPHHPVILCIKLSHSPKMHGSPPGANLRSLITNLPGKLYLNHVLKIQPGVV